MFFINIFIYIFNFSIGFLESLDDFYLMSNGLVMLQTTNNVFNQSLYDLVQPKSVPAWLRVRTANHLSRNSSDWGKYYSMYNSGMKSLQMIKNSLNS